MDKLLYTLILDDIDSLNIQSAIGRLQKNHNEKDKDYLYLRCYSEYVQKNFYSSLDFLLFCLVKFPSEFESDQKFLILLQKILEQMGKYDLLNSLKNPKEREDVLNKLALWQGYKYD